MQALGTCCASNFNLDISTCNGEGKGQSTIVDILSKIQGPWSIIYWQVTVSGKFLCYVNWPCAPSILVFSCRSLLTKPIMFRIEQKLCGLVAMPLVGEVFLFTGQQWRILGFCCLLHHQLLPYFTALVYCAW